MKAKAMKKIDRVKGSTTRARDWTAGDRIGKITMPVIREMHLRVAVYGAPQDDEWERLGDVLELAEDILVATVEASGEHELTLNECPDQIRSLAERRTEVEDGLDEEKQDLEKQVTELKERIVDLEKDHDIDMHETHKLLDEMKRRAALTEHELSEAKRATNGSDIDARDALEKALDEQRSRAVSLEKDVDIWVEQNRRDRETIAALEKALAIARANMRTRKSKAR